MFNVYIMMFFSFEKGLIHENHSSNSHNPIKHVPPAKFPIPYLFYLFGKPWLILGSLLFLMLIMICLKLTFFFLLEMARNLKRGGWCGNRGVANFVLLYSQFNQIYSVCGKSKVFFITFFPLVFWSSHARFLSKSL